MNFLKLVSLTFNTLSYVEVKEKKIVAPLLCFYQASSSSSRPASVSREMQFLLFRSLPLFTLPLLSFFADCSYLFTTVAVMS